MQKFKSLAIAALAAAGFAVAAFGEGEVISLNFVSGKGKADAGSNYGAYPLDGSAWNNLYEANGSSAQLTIWNGSATETLTSMTASWSSGAVWGGGDYNIMAGYLDDNDSNQATVTLTGIPTDTFANYDVYISKAGDSSESMSAVSVNGTSYTCGTDGEGVIGTEQWGHTKFGTAVLGLNTIVVRDVSGSSLEIKGGKRSEGRGAICAVQIVSTVPVRAITASTTVSSINAEEGNASTIRLSLADEVTLTMDEAFTATKVVLFGSGTATLSAAEQPPSEELAKIDISGYAGILKRTWSRASSVGVNFVSGYGNDTTRALADSAWTHTSGGSGEAALSADGMVKVSWLSYTIYSDWQSGGTMLRGYIDDTDTGVHVKVSGMRSDKYDVIVYSTTDNSDENGLKPMYINGTFYTWDATASNTVAGTSTWGHGNSSTTPAFGVNALRVNDLSGLMTIDTQPRGSSNGRGCIGAIQILPHQEGKAFDVTGTLLISDVNAAALTNDVIRINFAEDATLVVDEAVHIGAATLKKTQSGAVTVTGTETYTATDDDLAAVFGTDSVSDVTLGAYTEHNIGYSRTLGADGYTFTADATICVTETDKEYGQGLFTMSGFEANRTIKVVSGDGSVLDVTADENGVATLTSDPQVAGGACLYDFTFTNTITTAAHSVESVTMDTEKDMVYNNEKALQLQSSPWVSMGVKLSSIENFTVALAGKVPSAANTFFLSFGSASYGGLLFLATNEDATKVNVCYYAPSTGVVELLTDMAVPNATDYRHLYVFVKTGAKTMDIYLDGTIWKSVTATSDLVLGTSDSSGIQPGSGFAGRPSPYVRVDTGDTTSEVEILRIFDYQISTAQMAALKTAYPYEAPSATSTRELTESGTWTETETTPWKYESGTEGAVMTNSSVANSAAIITVNASGESVELASSESTVSSLEVDGNAKLVLTEGSGLVRNTGATTINTDLAIEYGAADIAGGPTTIASGKTLAFDYSKYTCAGVHEKQVAVRLTGMIAEQAEGVVTCTLPATDVNAYSFGYDAVSGAYAVYVEPNHASGTTLYLPSGTTELTDATVLKLEDGSDAVMVAGDKLVISNSVSGLTLNHSIAISGIEITNGATVKVINGTDGYALNGETVTITDGKLVLHNNDQDGNDPKVKSATINISEKGELDNYGWVEIDGTLAVNSGYTKTVLHNSDYAQPSALKGTGTIAFAGGGTITLASRFSAAHPVTIAANTTLRLRDNDEYEAGAITGDGKLVIPAGTTVSTSAYPAQLDVDATGTLALALAYGSTKTAVTLPTIAGKLVIKGISGNDVYFATTTIPAFELAGDITINDGSSNTTYTFGEVSGAGSITFNSSISNAQFVFPEIVGTNMTLYAGANQTMTVNQLTPNTTPWPKRGDRVLATTSPDRITIETIKLGSMVLPGSDFLKKQDDGYYFKGTGLYINIR